MHHTPHRRTAFSLLEMSIVLVILGLLIGGAITAQSFIKTAKLSTMMSETKYYMNAWGQFQEKYIAIPGDFSTAATVWPTATSGDGDSILVSATRSLKTSPLGPIFSPEVLYVFQHLSLAGFIDGSYNGATLVDVDGLNIVSPGVNVPRSSLKNTVYLFDHPIAADGAVTAITDSGVYYDGFYGHIMRVAGKTSASIGVPSDAILTAEQAYSIDTKFDDGKPGSGTVMTPTQTYMSGCTSSDVATTAEYDISTSTMKCILILKLP